MSYAEHFKSKPLIAGVDEAGRGPLAGPVTAAAVILPKNHKIFGLTDSKKLSARRREKLYDEIYENAIAVGVGSVNVEDIDKENILNATQKAMYKALGTLKTKPDNALIDGYALPNQNGAPLRLIVPWKYGFKGIKSIVKMSFVEQQPRTSWEMAAPDEYGFYANVNPKVPHPRWSQARERRIGSGLFAEKIPTLMFNGYGEHVAHLYKGLNLRRHF